MRYSVQSQFAKDYAAMAARLQKWQTVHAMTRIVLWLLVPIAYLGLLLCITVGALMPFKILQSFKIGPPSIGYWFSATIISGLVLFILYRLNRRIVWEFRQHLIDVDTLVMSAGFTLSAVLIALIFRHGLS
jgi:hypothetical protein